MSQVVQYTNNKPAKLGEAEEEWVTTKKVDIVTTKSVERKIQRQIVLEDGRVVEEEVPTVTVDTTEDKQTFQTDQDEDREVEDGDQRRIPTKFDGSVLVGDKFTRGKKTNDVTESLVKTEALQNLGDIRSRVSWRENIHWFHLVMFCSGRMSRKFWTIRTISENI